MFITQQLPGAEAPVINPFNPLAAFFKPLAIGEISLVKLIASYFEHSEDIQSCDLFLANPEIAMVTNINNHTQRVIINKFIVASLLRYRAITGIAVWNVLPFAANDGLIEDWTTVMRDIIVPYFKINKVLTTIEDYYNPKPIKG